MKARGLFRTIVTAGSLPLFGMSLFASGAARGVPVAANMKAAASATYQERLPYHEVRLKSPGLPYVWLRSITTELGSSVLEILEAQELCLRGSGARPGSSERQLACTNDLFADEVPKHKVLVSGFFMDRTEVRVRDYQKCVEARRCRPLRDSEGAARFFKPEDPVSMVSWFEARDFCEFQQGRLPTEAEFERAARGASRPVETEPDQTVWRARVFPWGDLYNSHASNHGGPALGAILATDEQALSTDPSDGFEEKAPVGSFPWGATPEGILDLAGNVAEWVYDLYAPYPKPTPPSTHEDTLTDPRGPVTTESGMRVARGGHYKSTAAELRGAARQAFAPETRNPTLGFRCAHDRAWHPEKRTP